MGRYRRVSIDMNPIENVWGDIVKLQESCVERNRFNNAGWNILGQRPDYWKKMFDSMSNWLMAVIEAEGQWTKY